MDKLDIVNLINSTDDKTSTVVKIELFGETAITYAEDKITLSAKEINIG